MVLLSRVPAQKIALGIESALGLHIHWEVAELLFLVLDLLWLIINHVELRRCSPPYEILLIGTNLFRRILIRRKCTRVGFH